MGVTMSTNQMDTSCGDSCDEAHERSFKRWIANGLSSINLFCGILSIGFALQGRFDMCFLMLLLGGACDGFDGAAARRWGSTRWGVLADDFADGVNYGLAPGVALSVVIGGIEGTLVGVGYAVFTISRLVYFTLNKKDADPNYFSGVPSPMGGLMILSSILLFSDRPALVGLIAGITSMLMVSWDTHYRHLGRMLGQFANSLKRQHAIIAASIFLATLLGSGAAFGWKGPAAMGLALGLSYGFMPIVGNLTRLVRDNVEERSHSANA